MKVVATTWQSFLLYIYKELKQLNKKKSNPMESGAKFMNWQFSNDIKMASKCMIFTIKHIQTLY